MRVLVMGVAGCGKSTLASALAPRLGLAFIEADDFHDGNARAMIASGRPLDDGDRAPWLARIAAALAVADTTGGSVLACSALKAAYRTMLAPDFIVHLALSPDAAKARLAARVGHFAGPALVSSQFDTLEPPATALVLDALAPLAELVEAVAAALDWR